MQAALPSVTVIIPVPPGHPEPLALAVVRRLDYPPERLEVLVVRGRHPGVQRNIATDVATGELVYHLDDDALPDPGNLRRAAAHFADPDVAAVGGPNPHPADAPLIEQAIAVAECSELAYGPSVARSEALGRVRDSGEKELICCNLMMRREAVVAAGGFDQALYPNEENALMDELRERGLRLVYDPAFVAFRRPRPTVRAYARAVASYGRGRAWQLRLHPGAGSLLNLAPPLLCVYLAASPLLVLWSSVALVPLGVYVAIVVAQTTVNAARHGLRLAGMAAPLLVLTNVRYGVGFLRGLFMRLEPAGEEVAAGVEVERIPPVPVTSP